MVEPEIGATQEVRLEFTQADFDEFARISGDDNPIHVDPAFAARTRFGRTVAHGMMLFGVLTSATRQWLGDTPAVFGQELSFRAPTFAGDRLRALLRVEEASPESLRVAQTIEGPDGVATTVGHTILARSGAPSPAPASESAAGTGHLHGIRPGMSARSERFIHLDDVAAYRTLVHDAAPGPSSGPVSRSPGDHVPPPLLGGLVSHLLGVELPGRGTNWLRQRFTFLDTVVPGSTVTTRVEVLRVRPEEALVDLATTSTVGGRTVADGTALVRIADLQH